VPAVTAILVSGANFFLDRVVELIGESDPRIDVYREIETAPHDRIEAFVCMRAPAVPLPPMPRLRFGFSPGAGADGLLACNGLARGLPLVRVVDPQQARRMAQYVAAMVLAQWRSLDALRERQRERRWLRALPPDETDAPVGVLGYGPLGRATAQALTALGFRVSAWTRSAHDPHDGDVALVSGRDALAALLCASRFLVVLLPLNTETEGLLDAARLALLPRGAYVINVSRAALIDQAALLDALHCGQVGGAALDVFATEPLPADSPWWNAPNVTVTPHIAAFPRPAFVARTFVETLHRAQAGETPPGVVDFAR
jgi:glyoxylate/hydroxypyruvate reductase A